MIALAAVRVRRRRGKTSKAWGYRVPSGRGSPSRAPAEVKGAVDSLVPETCYRHAIAEAARGTGRTIVSR